MFWWVLYEGRSISLYRNRPIWADAAGGDFALFQKGLAKTFQFFGNNLVQSLNKNSEWSELFGLLGIISASSDMVWVELSRVWYGAIYNALIE